MRIDETFPARAQRLLGADFTALNASNYRHWMAVREEHAKFDDDHVRRELRWIIENGYRWRPAPQPIDEAAVSRIVATMSRMRQAPGLYGGAAAVDAMCSIGEAMIERAGA